MDKKIVSGSYIGVSEEKKGSLYPMCFGVSCVFFAIRILTEIDKEDEKLFELRDKMLQGSAQLLGLLVWRMRREGASMESSELLHKLKTAEKQIIELKKIRHEEAKANEKVVGIFASQEQDWLSERKRLRLHIRAVIHELRVLEKQKDEAITELNEELKEMVLTVESKNKLLEEEAGKRKELEEKLIKAEYSVEELKETSKREAQEHSSELWKHKTAVIELVSNQRQLEAEMGRAIRQVESKKEELASVRDTKEDLVSLNQKLSIEIVNTRKDLEQKDKILSAMLRKSKFDIAENQMLLTELKLSNAKRKQAEMETEKWRVPELRHERHSLRSMFANQANSRLDIPYGKIRSQSADVIEYEHPGLNKIPENSPMSDCHSSKVNEEREITGDIRRLEGWVRLESDKYANVMEKRHHLELEAFAEQMRLKDENVETLHWRLLSTELESKRMQSYVDELNKDTSQLRHDNMKLQALLMEREEELMSLNDNLALQLKRTSKHSVDDPEIKITRTKHMEIEHETETISTEVCQDHQKEADSPDNQSNIPFVVQSPGNEFEEETEAISIKSSIEDGSRSPMESDTSEKLASTCHGLTDANSSPWRMNLHALGVSYKIKRLKQQLLMLERLTGKQDSESNDTGQKAFVFLISLLNKQVNRYQSLQGKVDDICKRMHENDLGSSCEDLTLSKTKGESKILERFLEETFQLQRYIVATGQKLLEFQSMISSSFAGVSTEELDKLSSSFDMKRFAESIRTLFLEVQRGLEVRLARIIGDLEGTLTCEGMIKFRR